MSEIGLGLQSDKRPGDYARLARLAEDCGFDVLSVFGDLLYQPPIVPLLEMAAATSRVRLGAACWNPYTNHPYEIAGQVAALDAVSGGRAYLGLARGSWLGGIGVEQTRPVTTVLEAAAVVRALLAGEDFAGSVFRLAPGTRLRYPVRRKQIPLLVGAWGPRLAAAAGRVADEVKIGGTANPKMVGVLRERLGNPDVGIVAGAVTVVAEDSRAARARARREVAMYLDVVAGLDPTAAVPADLLARIREHLARGDEAAAGALIPDDVLDLFAFSGTPEEIAQQAQQLLDAGAARVEFGTPHGLADDEGVALLGRRVLPLLR
ncbi:LLM class flavin-dependent oxidoreductase [Amycolatopsis benzoatilytica]|uniref:LLM class flavin-dependent oxidoreductase n=1 Tax=Amycolatopsis benzoatilytica TaxID=346045 RepID=UPI000364CDD2|nr:LLM class flavin-dependent oxidoreductase [Amycolatopsis benzoatilytica]